MSVSVCTTAATPPCKAFWSYFDVAIFVLKARILALMFFVLSPYELSSAWTRKKKTSMDEKSERKQHPPSLCVIFMILVSLENVKKCVLGGCTITSKTKINVFLNRPLRYRSVRFFFQKDDFSLWGKQYIDYCPVKMRPKLWKSHIVHPIKN